MLEKFELCRIWAKVLPDNRAIIVVQPSSGGDPTFYEAPSVDQIEIITERLIKSFAEAIPFGLEASPNEDNTEMIVYSWV